MYKMYVQDVCIKYKMYFFCSCGNRGLGAGGSRTGTAVDQYRNEVTYREARYQSLTSSTN